ncbi:hypothetical protein [Microbacterium sp. A93]|uniref:hypothetical protein n=1 Tax=Microbacterium sp. A93 TaxID=3450716 RepID=UPI003F43F3C3
MKRFLWFALPLLLIALGGVTFTPLPVPDLATVRQGAKIIVAIATLITAMLFAFADTTPSAKPGTTKLKGQEWRRDRAKLITHGAVIGIALFVVLATINREW